MPTLPDSSWLVRLVHVGAPKVLVAIMLLLTWSTQLPKHKRFDLLDLFSGQGNASAHWKSMGHTVGTIDIERGACMDFNSSAGFALVLWIIMNEKPMAINLMGPQCSSWGLPNRGTSMRNYINFRGMEGHAYVADANKLISRVVLAILVMTAAHAVWLLEHPATSLIVRHDRFEWLCNSVLYVYRQSFWLMHWGGGSPKRTTMFSNSASVKELDRGILSRKHRKSKPIVKTSRRYVQKTTGKRCYVGTSELKTAGVYPMEFVKQIYNVFVGKEQAIVNCFQNLRDEYNSLLAQE